MILLLMRFWPVLLPIFLYILWMLCVRNRARKIGEAVPRFRDGPWFWAAISALAIGVLLLVVSGLSHESVKGTYIPPHLENGHIVPGRIQP